MHDTIADTIHDTIHDDPKAMVRAVDWLPSDITLVPLDIANCSCQLEKFWPRERIFWLSKPGPLWSRCKIFLRDTHVSVML